MPATAENRPSETVRTPDPREALDRTKQAAIIALLKLGFSRRMVARQLGFCHTTIARTAARDGRFAAELIAAELEVDLRALRLIQEYMDLRGNWRAAAWLLERRNPEEYGRRQPHTFDGDQVLQILERVYTRAMPALKEEQTDEFLAFLDDEIKEVAEQAARANPQRRNRTAPIDHQPEEDSVEPEPAAEEAVTVETALPESAAPVAAAEPPTTPEPAMPALPLRPVSAADVHQSCPSSRAERKQLARRKFMAAKELEQMARSAPPAAAMRGGADLDRLLAHTGDGRP